MNEGNMDFSKSNEVFTRYVEDIEDNKISDISIRRALKKYDVKNLKINNVTPLRAKKMYASLLSKYENGTMTEKNWLQNQRRLFVWCVICYLHKHSLQISEMKTQDYEIFKTMFPMKDLELIKFQIFGLLKKDKKSSQWIEIQDKILTKIVLSKQSKEIQWSLISKEFFITSEENYFRNPKQCRERWLNHLDPNKTKGKWERGQDIVLLQQVLEIGKKWSKIVIALEGKKNQHMVKNRFKSLIHRKQKSLKKTKLKENQIIKMALEDLQNQVNEEENEEKSSDEEISESSSEIQEEQNEKMFKHEKSEKNRAQGKQITEQKVKDEKKLPIIVKPNADFVPFIRNIDEEQQQLQLQEQNKVQVEIFGNKNDTEMYDRLFQNNSTPLAGENNNVRYPSMYFDSRSPGNLFVSPYAGWTPNYLIYEGDVSPQMSLGNFYSKFKSDFHKFVNDEEQKPEK